MASPASNEASEVRRRGRQRLIGAIALVIMLVVFVPMVLDSDPRSTRSQPVATIPSKDNPPALPPPAPAASVKAQDAKVEPTPPIRGDASAAIPETRPAGAPALEGFAVQVGAFRDEAKLKQARDKLVAAGVAHYTERLEATSGPLTRLRAGPFATREAAEAAQAKLKRGALDGKVVSLP